MKLPMKKNYHFFYKLDDFDDNHPEIMESGTFFPDENSTFRDVISYLDQQHYDIRNSVIKRLVEYAGSQFGGNHKNINQDK